MYGGLSIRDRLLVLADARGSVEVTVFDLDERRVMTRFRAGTDLGYADAGGIALAPDSSLFVPITSASLVLRLSLFGSELARIGPPERAVPRDRAGLLGPPRAVAIDRRQDLWVVSGDRPRVHGLQVFTKEGRFVRSVPAYGRAGSSYGPALDVAVSGSMVWVADTGNDVVQCFRDDGEFVAAFEVPDWGEPSAVAACGDLRAVLVRKPRPAVLLFDRNFRRLAELRRTEGGPLRAPCALAFPAERELYVLDRDAERVTRFRLDDEVGEVVYDADEF